MSEVIKLPKNWVEKKWGKSLLLKEVDYQGQLKAYRLR
jgi:hypothetical protein